MAPNPNPARITAAMWWLWEQLHALEPRDTTLGGIYANKKGYHQTRNGNPAGNYSIKDPQDRRGPGDKAAALDWTFRSAQGGNYSVIAKYMSRLMASGKDRNDERLNGWREFYGQADKDRHVEGWDCRYLVEVTSDDSHLWHIHFSESREHVESRANKDALLSVLKGEPLAAWRARTHGTPKPSPGGPRPGYPTLYAGTGGPEDPTGTQRWWVSHWYRLMARHSPGYYAKIAHNPHGAAEIKRLEIGNVTLATVHDMARQVLGDQLTWRGAITPQIWAIYPPIT